MTLKERIDSRLAVFHVRLVRTRGGYMFFSDPVLIGEHDCAYVFAKNIRDPFTFFVGREPNFFYWSEKLVSAPHWYWEKEVDGDLLRQNLQEALDARFSPGEFDADTLPDADRAMPESWYDVISAEAERNEWGLDSEEIGGIVSASTKPDKCFVSVCYILQHVENLAKYGGDNG